MSYFPNFRPFTPTYLSPTPIDPQITTEPSESTTQEDLISNPNNALTTSATTRQKRPADQIEGFHKEEEKRSKPEEFSELESALLSEHAENAFEMRDPNPLRQVLSFLTSEEIPPIHLINTLASAGDELLVNLVKEIESYYPLHLESVFTLSSPEISLKIGKLLTDSLAINEAKRGLNSKLCVLSEEQKEQVRCVLRHGEYDLGSNGENAKPSAILSSWKLALETNDSDALLSLAEKLLSVMSVDCVPLFEQLSFKEARVLFSLLQFKAKEKIEKLQLKMPILEVPDSKTIDQMVVPDEWITHAAPEPYCPALFALLKVARSAAEAKSDITVIVEGRPVFAHTFILAKMDYFEKLGQMPQRVILWGISYQTFLILLEYFYTGELTSALTIEQRCELLNALEFLFPGKVNAVKNGELNHPLAMNLKYEIYALCFSEAKELSSNIFCLCRRLSNPPSLPHLSYLRKAMLSYLANHWHRLNLYSPEFEGLSERDKKAIYTLIYASLVRTNQILSAALT